MVLPSRVAAQDVTVTPLEWAEPDDPPDQLPVAKSPLQPVFPADLRNTPDPGYVLIQRYLDEKGRSLLFVTKATLPAYEEAVHHANHDLKFKPGRRQGQPVNTFTRFAVIFNPASAAPGLADATPRLLAARAVIDPARKTPKGVPSLPPAVVWATVGIDATGQPTKVTDAPPDLTGPIEKSLQSWRFAPARRGGQPVAADIRLPFIVTDGELAFQGESIPPKAIFQTPPVYPRALRESGLRGEVVVDFVVDREGRVTHPTVVRTLNPAFDDAALDAVRRWKFEPGRRGGVPVTTHMQVPMGFVLNGMDDGGSAGVEVPKKANQADWPEELRYDVPPKPRGRTAAVYPYALLRQGVKGEAKVSFIVNEKGRVVAAKVLSATEPDFGAAAVAMVQEWEFEPAIRDGRPTISSLSLTQAFAPGDTELVSLATHDLLETEKMLAKEIVSPAKLDKPLSVANNRAPVFPVTVADTLDQGSATVEVLIDGEGHVRLPRVVTASDPAFGWAAVQATASWRFDPPTRGGFPVTTRVRIPFEFKQHPVHPEAAVQK